MSDTRDPFHNESQDQDEHPTVEMQIETPHDALGAYVLGALSAGERRMFEMHVFICAACRANLAAHEQTAGLLAYGLPAQQPPASARERLLARARSEASGSPTVVAPAIRGDAPATAIPDDQSPTLVSEPATVDLDLPATEDAQTVVEATPVTSLDAPATLPIARAQPRRAMRVKLASLGWAAALLFVIASGLFFGAWSVTGPHPSFEIEVLSRLPGGQVLSLHGTGVPSASARLYVAEDGRRAELTVDALPPLPPGRVYQLWFAEPNQPTRTGGAFGVDPRGDASVRVTIPTPLERVRAVAVTQEPAPGLSAPTGVHLLDWTP